jgi:Tfp pilus assembly protein PilF
MGRYLKSILILGLILPACDAFVCSQERIKAIEIANKGVEAFKNNLYDSAERELRLSIQTDPTYEMAHYNLGKVYQKQRKWDKAIDAFEGAAKLSPNNANFQYDLGGDRAQEGDGAGPQALQGPVALGIGVRF